jgi:hypothetical protein
MSRKKNKCSCCNKGYNKIPCTLPTIIPFREIPDNCVLICNGPFCTLACFGSELPSTNCDIVCDEEGNCQLICHFSIGG